MKHLEGLLSGYRPRTLLLAQEMLRICVTILAHQKEDPKSTLAKGPVLKIIRNVLSSLGWLDAEMAIGEDR